jgi:hypothetical protein
VASSRTAATTRLGTTHYENRSSGSLLLMDIEVNSPSTEQSLKQPL